MAEKNIKARIVHKHDLEVNWLKAENFIPKKGEIIVYDIEVDANGEILKDEEGNLLIPDNRKAYTDGSSSFPADPFLAPHIKIGDGISNVNDLPFVITNGTGATEVGAIALGEETKATGRHSFASGGITKAGVITRAYGKHSHAEGTGTLASEQGSHAEGGGSEATHRFAHAEGYMTKAKGINSHTEGETTISSGNSSHAEGNGCVSTGAHAHAEGRSTTSSGEGSHAEGEFSQATGLGSHAEGVPATIANNNPVRARSRGSHAEGIGTYATGAGAHAEGSGTVAAGYHSHSEGYNSETYGEGAHTHGVNTFAPFYAETVYGTYNIIDTQVDGMDMSNIDNASNFKGLYAANTSYVIGDIVIYEGAYYQAVNDNVSPDAEHLKEILLYTDWSPVFTQSGEYKGEFDSIIATTYVKSDVVYYDGFLYIARKNITTSVTPPEDSASWMRWQLGNSLNKGKYVLVIGNGTSEENRSNAYTLDWTGNGWFSGEVKVGGTSQDDTEAQTLTTTKYVDDKADSLMAQINNKVDKIDGKQLSTEDFTTELLSKLNNLENADLSGYSTTTEIDNKLTQYISNTEAKAEIARYYAEEAAAIEGFEFIGKLGTGTNSAIFNNTIDNIASGNYSHSEGNKSQAIGEGAHAEGVPASNGTTTLAKAKGSHAEGVGSHAIAHGSHAEGGATVAGISETEGNFAHAEGYMTQALGKHSHAEGDQTQTTNLGGHSEGHLTKAIGYAAHAEGDGTTASGQTAHAEGFATLSGSLATHSEGRGTSGFGYYSHARNGYNIAAGAVQSVSGFYNKPDVWNDLDIAHQRQYVGTYSSEKTYYRGNAVLHNNELWLCIAEENVAVNTAPTASNSYWRNWQTRDASKLGAYAEIVGNGTSEEDRNNAYTLDWSGNGWFAGNIQTTGADYAEYFEWADGNPEAEDRVGHFVTLVDDKIALANETSDIIGVVSAVPAIIGDSYESQWNGKYLTDIYGRTIYEEVEVEYEKIIGFDENDKEIIEKYSVLEKRPKLNPEYDNTKNYIPRSKRPEWSTVGFLGKLIVIDDGTCAVGGKCSCNANGTATRGDEYRVLKRLDENHIQILANFL